MKKLISIFLILFLFPIVGFTETTKLLQNTNRDDGFISNVKKAITTKSASFTYDVGDPIPLIDTTSGDVTITMPAITDWDDEAYRHEIEVAHVAGGNDVIVQLDGVETFAWGNTYFNLGSALKGFTLAALNYGALEAYGILRNVTVRASAHRDAAWASSNFSSITVIPWDSEEYNNQDELLVYTAGAGARYTVLTGGTYKVNALVEIIPTAGTWSVIVQAYVNGVAVDNLRASGGSDRNEDLSLVIPIDYVDLDAGDYIDLRIIQTGLTGNLVHAMFNIEIRL